MTDCTSKENGLDQEVVRAEHLIRAYESVYDGYSLDRVLADPELGSALTRKCLEIGIPGSPKDWNHLLLRLRKAGKLQLPTRNRTEFSWSEVDEFLFASEIAWNEMKGHGTLDEILCDPELANRFDEIARNLAPGFSSLQYRWGALTLRKKSKAAARSLKIFHRPLAEGIRSAQRTQIVHECSRHLELAGTVFDYGRLAAANQVHVRG